MRLFSSCLGQAQFDTGVLVGPGAVVVSIAYVEVGALVVSRAYVEVKVLVGS
jgi:tetrahydrodipicolinate N-succinyltransferase